MTNPYSASGTAVWYGTGRVICQADTDGMAELIAQAMNAFAIEQQTKRKG